MSSVIASADRSTGMVATVKMGSQSMKIDESGVATGEDTGPGPMDYIMSALGSCTVITLQMYAQRKNWPLERAQVTLQQRTLSGLEADLTPGNKRTVISKTLQLTGDLTPDQIERLKDISSRCPVQRTLEAGVLIETTLV
ncbi:osmotically inducible protein C [Adhaeribacter arboris]|uniref:Osmotically inducible protein C n=1 Tax=Adhaeribacter arboris TaxID=2072846 RepID=A0A2T2YLG9_9BACT|nr:OsmC family protein [Adhaeribacter arboris]PSR56354.1 osmotically inducible protein C [Adhaeribacter arboris]